MVRLIIIIWSEKNGQMKKCVNGGSLKIESLGFRHVMKRVETYDYKTHVEMSRGMNVYGWK